MNGPQQLREWMERTRRDVATASDFIGVSQSTLYRLLDESRKPSLRLATIIQSITGIPATVWAEARRE